MVIHEFYKYHVDYNSGHDDYVLQIFVGPSIITSAE